MRLSLHKLLGGGLAVRQKLLLLLLLRWLRRQKLLLLLLLYLPRLLLQHRLLLLPLRGHRLRGSRPGLRGSHGTASRACRRCRRQLCLLRLVPRQVRLRRRQCSGISPPRLGANWIRVQDLLAASS